MLSASSSLPLPLPPTLKGHQEIASFALEETDDISDFLNKDITRFLEVFFVYSKIEHIENGSVSMVEIPFNGEMINRLLLKFLKGNLGALEWLVFHRFLQGDEVKKKIYMYAHKFFFLIYQVVAHEISHSWTGNLVTTKTWEHFWYVRAAKSVHISSYIVLHNSQLSVSGQFVRKSIRPLGKSCID